MTGKDKQDKAKIVDELKAKWLGRKQKFNPLYVYHILCTYYGFISWKEFLELPLPLVFELLKFIEKDLKENQARIPRRRL